MASLDLFSENAEAIADGVSRADPLRSCEYLANEFLLWLWFRTEHDFGAFELSNGSVDFWFDDRMTFLAVDEKTITSAFSGGAPSTTPEAKLSILSGKVIVEARVGLRKGEHEWYATLKVRGGEVLLQGVKTPAVIKDGVEEMVYERVFLTDVVIKAIAELFQRFFKERMAPSWHTEVAVNMRQWLLGE